MGRFVFLILHHDVRTDRTKSPYSIGHLPLRGRCPKKEGRKEGRKKQIKEIASETLHGGRKKGHRQLHFYPVPISALWFTRVFILKEVIRLTHLHSHFRPARRLYRFPVRHRPTFLCFLFWLTHTGLDILRERI